MSGVTVLHYLTQWMWLSDSFVFGPISKSRHRTPTVSRMPVINDHVYPAPPSLHSLTDGRDGTAPAEGAEAAAAVGALLGRTPVDVVHAHHGYSLPDVTAIAAELHAPLVVSFWGYDITALPSRAPQRVLPYLSAVEVAVVPSRFLAARVAEAGVTPQRIRILPGAVDTALFSPSPLPSASRVAFVGRFVAKKGIDTLLRAWVRVRARVADAELAILGYGDDVPDASAALGVRVLHPDSRDPRGQVRDLLRWCRIYVSPSRTGPDGDSESQHVGNVEAQASGRIVVTSRHGGIPEFVDDGVTGLLVPEGDDALLAANLVDLMRDDDRCRAIVEQAVRSARRCDVMAVSRRHDRLHAELAGVALG
jgi:glycosyltransferase involved in cell wall biosynthesis